MLERPSGTVTLLFTDIEGSTRLLQRLGDRYAPVLGRHHAILRDAVRSAGGVEVKTEGDSFFVMFEAAGVAVACAIAAQRALAGEPWPDDARVTVRMGIHTGEVTVVAGEYVGLDIHRAARVAAAAHGGQVLITDATRALVRDGLPAGTSLHDLGEHRLRDLERPERLFQLVVDGLTSEFPPIRSLTARLEILPSELSSFVGREREVEQLVSLLERTRLLTLSGPGGTGKTRLALAVARRIAPRFADGVAFVELAPLTDPALVAPTVRHALGFAEEPGRPALETLVDAMKGKEVLLVLDNFEQVVAGAPVIAELLSRTDRLRALVTSRSVLHITGEQEFPVPPLDIPEPGTAGDLATLLRSESVALFVQRARAVRPDFEVTPENAQAIVEICRRLDGLPLAIELAASRVKLLSPRALRARLGRSLDLLESTAADRTDRQRTLRGAIAWSHDLLAPPDRALLRRLSIFVDGWTYEAAETVAGAADTSLAGGLQDVLTALGSLVDQSLVRLVDAGEEPRFTMLETIREFGLERLDEAGEREAIARAHATYIAALAQEAAPALTRGAAWLDRLEREHDNLRAMLHWAAEHDMALALETAGSVWRFFHLRGHIREGRGLLAALLARPSAAPRTAARARALVGLAGLAYWQGDYDVSGSAYDEALAIARAAGERGLEAETLYSIGYLRGVAKDYDGARRAIREAESIHETADDRLGLANARFALGMMDSLAGDHADARSTFEGSLALFRELGDAFGETNVVTVLTRTLTNLGDLRAARRYAMDAVKHTHRVRDLTGLQAALGDIASVAALSGDVRDAARLLGAAQRIAEDMGGQAPPALIDRIDPMAVIRPALGVEGTDAVVAEGRTMTVDEAAAFALRWAERAEEHVDDAVS